MFRRVRQADAQWFAYWAVRDQDYLPECYPHLVGIPHPGTEWDEESDPPFLAPNANDDSLSDLQMEELDRIIMRQLGKPARYNVGLYGGFLHEGWGEKEGFNPAYSTWIFGLNLNHLLFEVESECGPFAFYRSEWDSPWSEVNFVWSLNHSWFVGSYANASFTIAASRDYTFVKELLNSPILNARELSFDSDKKLVIKTDSMFSKNK